MTKRYKDKKSLFALKVLFVLVPLFIVLAISNFIFSNRVNNLNATLDGLENKIVLEDKYEELQSEIETLEEKLEKINEFLDN